MKIASDGRAFVAVKTSRTTPGQTLVGLLVRSPDGTWTPLIKVTNTDFDPTRPNVVLDEVNRKVYVFYASFFSDVYYKAADMDALVFPDTSVGTPLMVSGTHPVSPSIGGPGGINNVTTTKQVLDPSNGDVLGFTSRPAYDPNAFASGLDRDTWASLMSDEDLPLNDRAIQGTYSPGSTFKMAVATAALQEGVIKPDFKVHCTGGATFYGRPFKCWKKGGHGTMDLRHAIEQSCNVYFYTIGNMTGIDKIHKWATLLGLGEKSGIDLPNEVQGIVPSPEWKKARTGEKWYAGETISVSIGQGQVSVTPISMAVYDSTIANGGTRVTLDTAMPPRMTMTSPTRLR